MRRLFEVLPLLSFLAADEGAGSGGAGDAGSQDNDNDGGEGSNAGASAGRTFTQADLDKIVQREKRKAADAERARIEDAAKAAALSETDRLRAEKETAERAANEANARANAKLARAEAMSRAVELGVKPERVSAAVKLVDLSDAIGDDGEPDSAAIKAAVSAMLDEFPEFKAGASANVGGGTNPAATSKPAPTLEERYADAQKAGNVSQMITLKRLIAEKAKGG